ncbi:MAG: acyltransferase family protein [Lachnospiraceae bacterium]
MENGRGKRRNSSVELLKIIAMIIIIIAHTIPVGASGEHVSVINLELATADVQYLIARLLRCFGQIGNDIFIVCSAWFLTDSKSANIKKIAYMIGDSFMISVGMVVFFLCINYQLPTKFIMKQFFPVTFGNMWFLTCYLLYYAVHPLLNLIINNLDKRRLLLVNAVLIMLYCIISYVMRGSLFYYNQLIGFIVLYFIVAYVKLYLKEATGKSKFNITVLSIGVLGWLIELLLTNILGLHSEFFADKVMRWNTYMNPFYILIAVGAFCLAKNHSFHNKGINYFSSLSLLVYIIHGNQIIVNYLKFDVWDYIFYHDAYGYLLLWIFVFAVLYIGMAFVLSVIYHETLQKLVAKVSGSLCNVVVNIYKKFESIVVKWD